MNSRPMSNIDKRALREAAERALSAKARLALMESVFDDDGEDVKPEAQEDISICVSFNDLTNPVTVLALLDELEAKDRRIAELETREKSLRTVGVMSQKAFQRLEGRESRFIALWPRPEIYLPRKRPADGVIVYARVAGAAKGE